MRFRKLRVVGFKSFVEPAELLIEPGLTGLVGPNGCGKSNLLEAIRWVMGEGSARSLRGGGMDDVIFAGSARRPPRAFAEVSLLIDADDAEHEVVRRIDRGAGSAYRIDGRDARARDVGLLFADAATGAHSPALVSQGRIAAVIAAKPAERRQMLEEAAGIAGLHMRRRDAEVRLRATEDNLARLDQVLVEAEARAATLRRQARAAERYRLLSAEIRAAEARALFARWREAARAAEAARAGADAAEEAVRAAAEAQRAAAAHLADGTQRLAEARTHSGAAVGLAGSARGRLEALRRDHAAVVRRLADLAARAEAIGRDRGREELLRGQTGEALDRLAREEAAIADAVAGAEARRDEVERALVEAERASREGEVAAARTQARVAGEEAEARVAHAALAVARGRDARAMAEQARLDREAAALDEETPLAEALATARDAQAQADARLVAAAAAGLEAETRRDAAAAARDAAESALARARATLAGAESEARALAAALAGAAGARLLDRLSVAPGYERALAAALGDDLDATVGDAGPRRWTGARPAPDDPALPFGATTLAEHVRGGDILARRLAQVAVVDADDGRTLAAGQRLVTREGRLRRWDGFMAEGAGATAAERLIRVNRRVELQAALPALRDARERAQAALDEAAVAQHAARATIEQVRSEAGAAEQALRHARRAEDAAVAALERRAATARALDGRRAAVDAERREADEAEADARTVVAALPDIARIRAELAARARAAEAARTRLAAARDETQGVARAIERDLNRREAVRAEAAGWRARGGDAAQRMADLAERLAAITAEQAPLRDHPAALELDIAAALSSAAVAETARIDASSSEAEIEAACRRQERHAAAVAAALADAREARAGIIARAGHEEERRAELSRLAGERFGCPAVLLAERVGFDADVVGAASDEGARHDRLAAERERLGAVNLVAEVELAELDATRASARADRAELGEAVARLRGSIGSLNREGRARLRAAFEAVDGHFRRLFATLFGGGDAHLALIDAEDPLEAGLEIMAQPPGKRLGSLTLLSGGEQALTAVALIFALFLTNPAPICVLDEVDAPLDDANIQRFCDLLAAMTGETDTRYIVVTHNAVTMSRMHRLFGVTMVEQGVSRLVSVDLGGVGTPAAAG